MPAPRVCVTGGVMRDRPRLTAPGLLSLPKKRPTRSGCQCRSAGDQGVPEGLPKPQDPVVRCHMPAERTMALVGIAIEADVLRQEMLKRAEQGVVPMRESQHRPEHALEPAILVAGDAECAGDGISRPGLLEIGFANRLQLERPVCRD